jgi:hypothetical protein
MLRVRVNRWRSRSIKDWVHQSTFGKLSRLDAVTIELEKNVLYVRFVFTIEIHHDFVVRLFYCKFRALNSPLSYDYPIAPSFRRLCIVYHEGFFAFSSWAFTSEPVKPYLLYCFTSDTAKSFVSLQTTVV